jgi:hypothetical protein
MKTLFLAVVLFFSGGLSGQTIVVFSKGDTLALISGAGAGSLESIGKAAYLNAFRDRISRGLNLEMPLELSDLPRWGRKIPGAGGSIQYRKSFRGGVILRAELAGLSPDHRYILCLNGNPERDGNTRLADPVPGNEKERYFDFITATTGPAGRFSAVFCIRLLPGPYDVRFYVKDTDDFKIVLYRDFFRFDVE